MLLFIIVVVFRNRLGSLSPPGPGGGRVLAVTAIVRVILVLSCGGSYLRGAIVRRTKYC